VTARLAPLAPRSLDFRSPLTLGPALGTNGELAAVRAIVDGVRHPVGAVGVFGARRLSDDGMPVVGLRSAPRQG
jgi:hypothetical protein